MSSYKTSINNPHSYCYASVTNKIAEWIVIFIIIAISFYFEYSNVKPHHQCIPGIDLNCSQYVSSPDPSIAYPVIQSTIDFTTMNIICPIIWFIIFIINSLIINYYNSMNKLLYKILFIKMEILFRSAAICIALTWLTTESIKLTVGRPRPNYLSNTNPNGKIKSFPSSHTSYIYSICFLFMLYSLHSLYNTRQLLSEIQINNIPIKKYNSNGFNIKPIQIVTDVINETDDIITPLCNKPIEKQMFLEMDQIINVFNGDSYFFLWLFIWLRNVQIISVLICITPTIFAGAIACSRLIDYKHHYSDVLGGALIGIFYSCVLFIYYKTEFYYGFDYKKIFSDENKNQVSMESQKRM